jgi:hypothetical protein
VLLIGALCCLAVEANPAADLEKPAGILSPDKKELAMEGTADQSPAETKHWWWYGKGHDWDKKKHGEHHGEKWEGKHKKVWWWKW